jgi:invasion protein IalB
MLKLHCLLAVIATITLTLAHATLSAAEEGKTFNDWKVVCDKIPDSEDKICHLQQLITAKDSKEPIVMVVVGYLPGQEDLTIVFTLPLGVLLPPGIGLQVDENKPVGVPFEVCDPIGCRAGFRLKEDMLEQFKKGNKANITFANVQRQKMTVPVSLSGISAGIASLK